MGAPVAAFPGNGLQRAELAEIATLKREVAKLKAERDILKKGEPCAPLVRAQWRAPTSRGKRHDVRFRGKASAHLAPLGDARIAERATGSAGCARCWASPRSGFHAWLRRPISERAAQDAKLVQSIDKSFKASDRTYGARRVWRDVLEEGLACGLHRIERLMRLNAMRARPKRRGNPKDDGERSVIADNILDRDFTADRPNQKWLADFTYIWTAEGWLYVAVVLDLFSRVRHCA
ncbi:IS3 family transposase [Loktanella sp. M215]|uniref:IS3 family transposase n=1 Tax=Loktanella sp. M215 TaxID=2675431 RepID=UPI001F1E38D7|nr:IS3 family transposase [Loktanella sp. M215]